MVITEKCNTTNPEIKMLNQKIRDQIRSVSRILKRKDP